MTQMSQIFNMSVVSDAICVYSPNLKHVTMTSCLTFIILDCTLNWNSVQNDSCFINMGKNTNKHLNTIHHGWHFHHATSIYFPFYLPIPINLTVHVVTCIHLHCLAYQISFLLTIFQLWYIVFLVNGKCYYFEIVIKVYKFLLRALCTA